MNNRWLQSFIMVSKIGSISKAAQELYLSPQALLQQINLLEQDIDIKLFNRGKSGVKLTLAGEEFYKGAQQMLDLYSSTLKKCHMIETKKNTIRIPVMSSIIIPKFMEKTCTIYNESNDNPTITIEMIPTGFSIHSLINGLNNNEYDIIEYFTINGYHPKDIYYEKFYDVQSWCLFHKDHPLVEKNEIKLEDLHGYCISATQLNLLRYLQAYIESSGIKVEFEEIPADRYEIIKACNSGNICFVNEEIAKEFTGFVSIPLAFDLKIESGLACRKASVDDYSTFFEAARLASLYSSG